MKKRNVVSLLALAIVVPVIAAAAQSIPDSQVDTSRVYYGSTASFDKAAEVNTETAIHSTPEYQEIVKKKIDSGTGKYWILVSAATDRVHRAIGEVGRHKDFDLIAEKGYLGKLDPPVSCSDITERVVSALSSQ